MRVIVFDTETTGFPSNDLSLAEQPYIVQFGAVILDCDPVTKTLTTLQEVDQLISVPVPIPADCTRVHGITSDMVAGKPDFPAFAHRMLEYFGQCQVVVAHNLDFDATVLGHELKRIGLPKNFLPDQRFDTMLALTDVLQIPNGRGGFKYPTLTESHTRLFGEAFVGAHHALQDTVATVRILAELLRRGIFTPKEPLQVGLF